MNLRERAHASASYRWNKLSQRVPLVRDGDSMTMWQRTVLNREVRDFVESRDLTSMAALEVSGSWWRSYPWASYTSTSYPSFDLVNPPDDFGGWGSADIVLAEQVLEHCVDPIAAARTLVALAKPGGFVVVSTPFLVKIHASPDDFWRFTPHGLARLLDRAGLVDLDVSSWGNRRCVRANFRRWTPYQPWRSLKNEPEFPLQVWAIGRRPDSHE